MITGIDIRWLSFRGTGLYTYLSTLPGTLLKIDERKSI